MPPDLGPKLIHARHGDLYAYPTDQYLGEAICKMGEYGELEYQFLRDVLEGYQHAGKSIVEVGANAGYLTVPLMRHGLMVAFEPQTCVNALLKWNCGANLGEPGLSYTVHQAAVSDKLGFIDCPVIPYSEQVNHGGIPMGKNPQMKAMSYEKIPCVTLDSLEYLGVKLIKVDVEGMEEKVLRGGRQLIARDRPILYVENDRLELSESLIKLVWSLDYWCAFHLPPLYNPDNFFRNPTNPWGNVVSINMVCVPNGQRLPAGVAIKHGLQLVEDAKQHPIRVEQ